MKTPTETPKEIRDITDLKITPELIVRAFELYREQPYPTRRILHELGWFFNGGTDVLDNLLNNLWLYLSPNIRIAHQKKVFKEAKKIIAEKYPHEILYQRHYSFRHQSELAPVSVFSIDEWRTIEEKEEPYQPTPKEKIRQALSGVRYAVEDYIESEIKARMERREKESQSKSEVAQQKPRDDKGLFVKQEIPEARKLLYDEIFNPKIELPPEIDDSGIKGYYFDELMECLKGTHAKAFRIWHKGKTTGYLDGRIYVLKEDVDKFLETTV